MITLFILCFYIEAMIMIAYRLIEDFGEKIKQIQIFKFENFEKLNKITLNPMHIF